MSGGIIYNRAAAQTYDTCEPTGALRWSKAGKLQQGFLVRKVVEGKCVEANNEWHDVRNEEDDARP